MELDQLKMAMRLHRVARFQTHHLLEPMSVAEHSFRVACLYDYLGGKELLAALLHDAEESLTGDIPSPVKKDLQGLEKYEAMRPPFLEESEKKLAKLADKLDLLIHIRPQTKYSEDLLQIYEKEYELALDIARELKLTKKLNQLIKELT